MAVELLEALIDGKGRMESPMRVAPPPVLVTRASTGPPGTGFSRSIRT
jgi:hypothetical protein